MQGMNRDTGMHLGATEHIRQSVKDILSTPLASRRMLMEYGSEVLDLVDHPDDRTTAIRVVMATAIALARWEPRIQIDAINVQKAGGGEILIDIDATDIESQLPIILEGISL
ncbi:baseplate assembly protein [Buttiauxella sp. 3AFRM03]|uniref:GPW/gp25 family protein n=1 Tax=Buttiauxella sp. 3AFRM03 TaxID=2479367 RepID=UPI000EF83CFA|nr:GPW/gp25 family protein [Buttiauxella sp. 3AFRM03]AYN30007.1 baseplate assembly protein [Buttiauxella sp. 3AFRM03]